MESKVVTEFSGYINKVHFTNEKNFSLVESVMRKLETKLNIEVTVGYIPDQISQYISRLVKNGITYPVVRGTLITFVNNSSDVQDFLNRLKTTTEYANLMK